MKPFHTIAVPHRDILEGKLTLDTFAADLWDVSRKKGPDEYRDAETFFRKTYLTEGLTNLLGTVEKRLKGQGGDPVIQIQTLFGGGKTHALIAMYHSAAKWKMNTAVVVGEDLETGNKAELFDTPWGVMEQQLTGSKKEFNSPIPPGGSQIRKFLENHRPALILMDELVPYLNMADAVRVENTTLTTLTLTFLGNLANAVSGMTGVSFVLTATPSNPYNPSPRGEEIVSQLQNIMARREIIKSPINDNEVTKVIRRRLFSDVDEGAARKTVSEFMRYAQKEELLPEGVQPSDYRDRFLDSYPFMPEVVDILYHRWGSFPNFQRTRGVLRLLALVVNSLKTKDKPYISLADVDLTNQDIRQELLRHAGPEYNGIIANDITDFEAGSQKVDISLGKTFQGLKLGTRAATTIFMYSFSGGSERGATMGEIKRCATTVDNPASTVIEAVGKLEEQLFYLQNQGGKYFFNNQPNLNRILLTTMENMHIEKITAAELGLIQKGVLGSTFKVYLWDENSGDVSESEDLKLVILKKENQDTINGIIKNKGQTLRVNRNTLFFVYPLETERPSFINTIKRKLAWELIDQDKSLSLSEEQKKYVKKELKEAIEKTETAIRDLYRIVAMPVKDGTRTTDLGIPTWGDNKSLVQSLYDKIRADGEIMEKIAPIVLLDKYLKDKDCVSTKQVYESSLKTPGEPRPVNKDVFEKGIIEGVCIGIFGLGEMESGKPVCRYFKETPTIAFSDNEVMITEKVCLEQKAKTAGAVSYPPATDKPPAPGGQIKTTGVLFEADQKNARTGITMSFTIPKGKVSDIARVLTFLQLRFGKLDVNLTAKDGSISEQEYEDKVKEAFQQLGIDVKED